ncbi:MAG: methyltransferase domain-containing protein [Pseudonocardia sp.]|nr:methyltransferase domain-containing protein [Pseudonocardia sp.]
MDTGARGDTEAERLADDLVRSARIRSTAVAEAFRTVPRHLFLPGVPLAEAYADEAVATQFVDGVATSSASQPSMVAIMLEQLGLRRGQRVLEIGAGTGWNAALMSRIVGPEGVVISLDIDEELVSRAERNLASAGVDGVTVLCADGALGHPDGAPYDRIVLTVGSWDVRPEWIEQLAPGGRILLPLTVRGSQLAIAFDAPGDGLLHSASVRSCAFIRLRGAGAGPEVTIDLGLPGWSVQAAEEVEVDRDAVRSALSEPGRSWPVVPDPGLGEADVWDGVGLWLALGDPAVFRLLATGEAAGSPVGTSLFVGRHRDRVTVALGGPDGFAALVTDDAGSGRPGDHAPVAVRAFGSGGPELAAELMRRIDGWTDAGRPHASDLAVLAAPRGTELPGGGAMVEKEHVRLSVRTRG